MIYVGDAPMALELGPREAACLGARDGVVDVSCAAQDGAIEGEGAHALEEL